MVAAPVPPYLTTPNDVGRPSPAGVLKIGWFTPSLYKSPVEEYEGASPSTPVPAEL